jgi:hypothetical protein
LGRAMKQKPVTFEVEYKAGDRLSLFEPYMVGDKTVGVVRLEMSAESLGTLVVRVYEQRSPQFGSFDWTWDPVYSEYVFDRHREFREEYGVVPTGEQFRLMEALAFGDLRGKYAEDTAKLLYIDLFLLNPETGLRKYIPKVVEWFEREWKEMGWKRISTSGTGEFQGEPR